MGNDHRATILVVDDTADLRLLCRINLELAGYEVLEAVDGHDALAVLETAAPQAVLLDVLMPRLDGFAVLAAIRADARFDGMTIIMMSALARTGDRARAVRDGADAYLAKPFLADAVTAILDGHGDG